jgi:aromatic-L-amino-acid decarboxylase
MDLTSFRAHAHALADWMADYLEQIEARRIVPAVAPGDTSRQLSPIPPEHGEPFEAILADFERVILPGMSHWQHPGWFGYFPANSSPPSVLAEMLTAALAANCMSWQTSPAATELEQVTLDWVRQLLGLPAGLVGVIQDTASSATLVAAITARDDAYRRAGSEVRLVFYTSEEAHSSVAKAARLAGFPVFRTIVTDAEYAMRPAALEEAIAGDVAAGRVPACVVATVGTTSSTGLDPLRPIGEVCRRHSVYLHVDAAYAGAAAVAPEFRGILDGVELADSFVVNPHKWLLTNFDCSAHYVRDPEPLLRAFRAAPEYLRTAADAAVVNYRDWGIPLGRRFRALKLWFVLRSYGAEGLRGVIREHVRLARRFGEWVAADPAFELMAPVRLGLVCFRFRPAGVEEEPELEVLNRRLLERVNASGRVFLTHTTLRGRYAIRLAVGQRTTEARHVEEAWRLVRASLG